MYNGFKKISIVGILNKNIRYHLPVCIFLACFICKGATCQEKLAPYTYLIRFTDKFHNKYSLQNPAAFLSARALLRRSTQSVPIDSSDLPVSRFYTDSLAHLGAEVLNQSKWLNAISVKITDTTIFSKLQTLSFVIHTASRYLQRRSKPMVRYTESYFPVSPKEFREEYGASFPQINLPDGIYLHKRGYRGEGMLIAVLDAGFNNAQDMTSLDSLWIDHRVLLTRDFVNPGGNVLMQDRHGSNVLSILAATSPGHLMGSAPMASYILLRSEDATLLPGGIQSEFPVEEFNWACAAELADSLGADLISSSLGYTTFDDPTLNHTYSDMNGKTTLVSIAAGTAASKGMIVVVSAGNEGSSAWHYISAPADAQPILAVGAVDSTGLPTDFSSRGPSSDGRIKPDVMAQGFQTALQMPDNSFVYGNGTSFSTPVIAGLTACLWQSCPGKTNIQIMNAIRNYASRSTHPDTLMGYGIPDFRKAFYALNPEKYEFQGTLFVYPTPFRTTFTLNFQAIPQGYVLLTIYSITGQKVFSEERTVYSEIPNSIAVNNMEDMPGGLYILTLTWPGGKLETKIVKL